MGYFFAERRLLYSHKGSSNKYELNVRINEPRLVNQGEVNFDFSLGTAVCKIEFNGLPESLVEEVFGVDSIQALSLATNIDSYLKGLQKKYDLYWIDGEPYFEE
jgi:hypothetical protein